MCFTHKKIKEKRKSKKTKIHPEPSITPPTFTMDETIRCQGCFLKFPLDGIKINCTKTSPEDGAPCWPGSPCESVNNN